MSLFVCSDCGVVENTALCRFWMRPDRDRAQCSACDPLIGVWHGRFPRVVDDGSRGVFWRDGRFLLDPAVDG